MMLLPSCHFRAARYLKRKELKKKHPNKKKEELELMEKARARLTRCPLTIHGHTAHKYMHAAVRAHTCMQLCSHAFVQPRSLRHARCHAHVHHKLCQQPELTPLPGPPPPVPPQAILYRPGVQAAKFGEVADQPIQTLQKSRHWVEKTASERCKQVGSLASMTFQATTLQPTSWQCAWPCRVRQAPFSTSLQLADRTMQPCKW